MIINMVGGGSGGAALNFDVVRYATESELLAATPKQNTIGIISTTEMTGWRFDANQPEDLQEGEVWFSVGTDSSVEFNALKENSIMVYPLSAKQYVNGALVHVTARNYQNNAWVIWWNGQLYERGNLWAEKTGGWSEIRAAGTVITWNEDSVRLSYTGTSGRYAGIRTTDKVKINGYKKAYAVISGATVQSSDLFVVFGITSTINEPPTTTTAGLTKFKAYTTIKSNNTNKQTVSFNLPTDGGEYYFEVSAGYSKVTIHEIFME